MPITYTIDPAKRLITEVWTGEISALDLRSYWDRYLRDPAVMAIRRTIADLCEAKIRFTGADLNELIDELVLPILNGRDWKTAIVVKEPHQFGVSRQYQVFAGSYSQDSIFGSVEDALQWLNRIDSEKPLKPLISA
jgi:hypothetical protein